MSGENEAEMLFASGFKPRTGVSMMVWFLLLLLRFRAGLWFMNGGNGNGLLLCAALWGLPDALLRKLLDMVERGFFLATSAGCTKL